MANHGQLSLYVDDVHAQDVVFSSTNSWSGTYGVVTVDLPIPNGATIKLQRDAGDAGTNVDYIELN